MVEHRILAGLVVLHVFVAASGCSVASEITSTVAELGGATDDVYCDRRFVGEGKEPAPFCQEVVDTIAASQIADNCRTRHAARTEHAKCPRERVVAGCKFKNENRDGSRVWDWYYDVSDLNAGGTGPKFLDPILTKDRVREMCADPKRYEEGAVYVDAP